MLTEKEKKIMRQYEDDLALPKWKYILVYGLSFSVLAAVFTFLTDYLLKNRSFGNFGWHLLIIIPVATFLYGILMRRFARRNYQKLKRKEPLPE
jgi:hypothetical protein